MSEINFPKVYRLRPNQNLHKYLSYLREQAIYEMQNTMEQVYSNWLKNAKATLAIRDSFRIPAEVSVEQVHCGCYLHNLYKSAVRSEDPSSFNLNALVKVVFHDKRYYLFPESQGIFDKIFDFMATDREIEDFSYNSARKSPRMSREEWEERATTWFEIVYESDSLDLGLTFDVMTVDKFTAIDPALEALRRRKAEDADIPPRPSFTSNPPSAPTATPTKPAYTPSVKAQVIAVEDDDIVEEEEVEQLPVAEEPKKIFGGRKRKMAPNVDITKIGRSIKAEALRDPEALKGIVAEMSESALVGLASD